MIYSLRFSLKHERSEHGKDRWLRPVPFVLLTSAPSSPFGRHKRTWRLLLIIRQGRKDLISRCTGRNAACRMLVISDQAVAPTVSVGGISIAPALPRTGLSHRRLPRSPGLQAGQGAGLFPCRATRPGVTPTCRNHAAMPLWDQGVRRWPCSRTRPVCAPICTPPALLVKPGSFMP